MGLSSEIERFFGFLISNMSQPFSTLSSAYQPVALKFVNCFKPKQKKMPVKFNDEKNLLFPTHVQFTYKSKYFTSKGLVVLAFLILVSSTVIDNCYAIKCYKCAVIIEKSRIENLTITTPMCSKFDESPEYIVECPFSTMCHKAISTLYLQNGQKQETITRGCAQQKDTTQVFRNRQWQQEHSVQEVYEEGCIEFKENNLAASGKTHCYCRGNLCNFAPHYYIISYEIYALASLTIFLFARTF